MVSKVSAAQSGEMNSPPTRAALSAALAAHVKRQNDASGKGKARRQQARRSTSGDNGSSSRKNAFGLRFLCPSPELARTLLRLCTMCTGALPENR